MREQERILIVGNGGREHALGWKIKQSPNNPELFFASGNAGTGRIGENLPIDPLEIDKLVQFASDNKIGLTVVGPEAPLERGIVNAFKEEKLKIFGPTREAARLETSKSWAIDFMQRHNIPHPISTVFTDPQKAEDFFEENLAWDEMVIKADGLASGKGVFLPNSQKEASNAIKRIMVDKEFDDGSKVIIQERLIGREVSMFAISDGKTIVPLLPAQDYKRLKDNDEGPNTGGMGAFAPSRLMSENSMKEVYGRILKPTIDGMRKEGNLFQGLLYAGLMLTADGPMVLEFNVRFGDPETQALMMLLESDLLPVLKNTTEDKLNKKDIVFRRGAAVCVVLATENYPGKPKTGDIIHGLNEISDPDVQIFHGATEFVNGQIKTNGGRAIEVSALGKTPKQARGKIYPLIGKNGVFFADMQFRHDIGS